MMPQRLGRVNRAVCANDVWLSGLASAWHPCGTNRQSVAPWPGCGARSANIGPQDLAAWPRVPPRVHFGQDVAACATADVRPSRPRSRGQPGGPGPPFGSGDRPSRARAKSEIAPVSAVLPSRVASVWHKSPISGPLARLRCTIGQHRPAGLGRFAPRPTWSALRPGRGRPCHRRCKSCRPAPRPRGQPGGPGPPFGSGDRP